MNTVFLKVLSDIRCHVYIDNEMKVTAEPNRIEKISLNRGEYWVEIVSVVNPAFKEERIITLDSDHVLKVDVIPMVESNIDKVRDEDLKYVPDARRYVNLITGKAVTSALYDEGHQFALGFAIVKRNGLYGFIDKRGYELVSCEYEIIEDVQYNMAKVKRGGKWGYLRIEKVIYEIVSCKYEVIKAFDNCRALVKSCGKWGCIDPNGKEIIPCIYDVCEDFIMDEAKVCRDMKWGCVHRDGYEVISCIYDIIEDFHNGKAKAMRDNKWGYITKDGVEIISCMYDKIDDFIDGKAKVSIAEKYGYIDVYGKEVQPCILIENSNWKEIVARELDQVSYIGFDRFKACKNGLWELFHINGYRISTKQYSDIQQLTNGVAKVQYGSKWGYIDIYGKETTPCIYSEIKPLNEGVEIALLHWKHGVPRYGLIDKAGKELTPMHIYEEIQPFQDGLARVKNSGRYGFVDVNGKEVTPCIYDFIHLCSGNPTIVGKDVYIDECNSYGKVRTIRARKYGIMDLTGKEIVPCKYDSASSFSEGYARVSRDRKYGFIDTTGKEVVPCKYDSASSFSEGYAWVCRERKYGFIDRMGNEVISCQYNDFGVFREGYASVCLTSKWGIINTEGEIVIPCIYDDIKRLDEKQVYLNKCGDSEIIYLDMDSNPHSRYDYVYSFSEGLAAVKRGGKYGFINEKGGEVVRCIYDSVQGFLNGLARVGIKNKYGLIDRSGTEVCACIYESLNSLELINDNYISVKQDGLWGIINIKGEEIIPCVCDQQCTYNAEHGLFRVTINHKSGFLDSAGAEVVPCDYAYTDNFYNGYAKVCMGGKWGYINISGKSVISCEYDSIEHLNNYLVVKQENKYGCIDWLGKVILPCVYDGVKSIRYNLVVVKLGEKYGCINLYGNTIVPNFYDDIIIISDSLMAVKNDGKWGIIQKGDQFTAAF